MIHGVGRDAAFIVRTIGKRRARRRDDFRNWLIREAA
jgi:hypothetical protein